jgi:hypothetical protein
MSQTLRPWAEYVDLLKPAEALVRGLSWKPDDPAYRADIYRQLAMNLSYAYFQYFQSNSDHPEFMPLWNSVYLFQPNPDDVYYYAPLDGTKRYRIFGDRGSIHMLMFQFGRGFHGMVEGAGEKTSSFLDGGELAVDANGRFEILLAPEKPPGFEGTWHRIREDVDFVLVRLRSYDWGNEVDTRMGIECLDAPPVKRRMPAAEIDERLRQAFTLSERLCPLFYGLQNNTLANVGKNRFELTGYDGIGLPKQLYWTAVFDLPHGEALILETELPKVRPYWNVQINDPYFNAVEFVYRQTSLNGHTARLDADGRFRAVISHVDPGVPNWLDTGDFTEGTIFGRWTQCDSAPLPTLKKVPLARVRDHLPADTPVVSPDERLARLRERRRGAQLRRRW